MGRTTKTTDMTTGNPIGHILRFALPLLVGNVFQQFYNMVDSLVVGNYVGANALAAVGNCGSVNSLFFALANGLSIGIGILVAQYFGAHDEEKIKAVIAIGTTALHINSLFYTVVGMIHVSRAVLNGCGDTGFALMNGLTEVICRICYSQFFTRIPALGYWGIWVTTAATWTTTAIVCIARYMSGVWKKKARP